MTTQEVSFPSDIVCADDGMVLLANGKLVQVVKGEITEERELNKAVSSGAFVRIRDERRLFLSCKNEVFCCSIASDVAVSELIPIDAPEEALIKSVVDSGEHILVGWENGNTSCYEASNLELISSLPGAPIEGNLLVQNEGATLGVTEAICGLRVKSIKFDKKAVRFFSAGYRTIGVCSADAAFTVPVDIPCVIGSMAPQSAFVGDAGKGKFKKQWEGANTDKQAKLIDQLRSEIPKAQHDVVTLLIDCKMWDAAIRFLPMLSEASMVRLLNARPRVNMVWAVAKESVTSTLLVAAMAKLQPIGAVLEQALRAVRLHHESSSHSLVKIPELPTMLQAMRLIVSIVDAKFHEISQSEPKMVEELTKVLNGLHGSMAAAPKMLATFKSFQFCPTPLSNDVITRVQLEL